MLHIIFEMSNSDIECIFLRNDMRSRYTFTVNKMLTRYCNNIILKRYLAIGGVNVCVQYSDRQFYKRTCFRIINRPTFSTTIQYFLQHFPLLFGNIIYSKLTFSDLLYEISV